MTICHDTGSLTNSFVRETVDASAVQEGGHHYNHEGRHHPAGTVGTERPQLDRRVAGGLQQRLPEHSAGTGECHGGPGVVCRRCGEAADGDAGEGPTGVSYAVAPPGPYDGTADYAVTVTATLADRVQLGHDAAGVDAAVDAATATLTVTLIGDVVCRGDAGGADGDAGGVSWWGVVRADVDVAGDRRDHLHASIPRGRMQQVTAVTVTATLETPGWRGRTTLPAGWMRDVDHDGDVHGDFACGVCAGGRRWIRTVMQATCVGGVVTAPTVTPASTGGDRPTRSIRRVRVTPGDGGLRR